MYFYTSYLILKRKKVEKKENTACITALCVIHVLSNVKEVLKMHHPEIAL